MAGYSTLLARRAVTAAVAAALTVGVPAFHPAALAALDGRTEFSAIPHIPDTELEQFIGGTGGARADFNGDGIDDLVAGVPREDVGSAADAGEVDIVFGSPQGLATAPALRLTQTAAGDQPEAGDQFGRAVATGNFDGDARPDLAIGSSGEDGRGVVDVFLTTPTGLAHAARLAVPETAGFGTALTAGDFDGDGRDELGVGAPDTTLSRTVPGLAPLRHGTVHLFAFANAGNSVTAALRQTLSQDTIFRQSQGGEVPSPVGAEAGDQFGRVLLAADFNGNGRDDLVIASPFEDLGSAADAGQVHVLADRANGPGLVSTTAIQLDQGVLDDDPETGDLFGGALAAGQFVGDADVDLVVGTALEDNPVAGTNAGRVHLVHGSASGITTTDVSFGGAAAGDRFGSSLTIADFDGSGRDDLVIGAPFAGAADQGTVRVHLRTTNGTAFQEFAGPTGFAESPAYGAALTWGDYNGDSVADLAVGAPRQPAVLGDAAQDQTTRVGRAGAVEQLHGSSGGLVRAPIERRFVHQCDTLIVVNSECEKDDAFGGVLY